MIRSIYCSDLFTNSRKICMIRSRYSSFFSSALILLAYKRSRKLPTMCSGPFIQFMRTKLQQQCMIELEEQINCAQQEEITAERMRKSSRLLRNSKSRQKIEPKYVESGKMSKLSFNNLQSWNWKQQKYTELLKLIRVSQKEEKGHENTKSLDFDDHNYDCFSQHFKGSWKPHLESEMLIAPCKQIKMPKNVVTQPNLEEHQYKSKHECIKFRNERKNQVAPFKFQIRKSYNRIENKHKKPSFIKHILKIEDQPLKMEEHQTPKPLQLLKEGITLQPLRKAHERLKSLTPEKTKEDIPNKKSNYLKKARRRSHMKMQSNSLNLKKLQVSAWTFHNIEQQI